MAAPRRVLLPWSLQVRNLTLRGLAEVFVYGRPSLTPSADAGITNPLLELPCPPTRLIVQTLSETRMRALRVRGKRWTPRPNLRLHNTHIDEYLATLLSEAPTEPFPGAGGRLLSRAYFASWLPSNQAISAKAQRSMTNPGGQEVGGSSPPSPTSRSSAAKRRFIWSVSAWAYRPLFDKDQIPSVNARKASCSDASLA